MQTADFLSLVLPCRGTRVLVEFSNTTKRNHTYVEGTPFTEIAADAQAMDRSGSTVYMALGGFAAETVSKFKGRTAENAQWFRSLWLDIDVGPDKDYKTRKEAADAFSMFINAVGLPAPTVVSSGYGMHVYWPLDQDCDTATWRTAAHALKSLADARGLRIDTNCTQDAARILRPVGTHNYKLATPREVKLIQSAGAVAFTSVQKYLASLPTPVTALLPRTNGRVNGHDAFGLSSLDAARPEDFNAKAIVEGCQQFRWAYEHQADVKEPMWRAMIGTLYRTSKPSCIHEFSRGHPGYTYAETEKKAKDWPGGGVACTTLENSRPGGCTGCAKLGIFKSPSSFGIRHQPIALPPPPKIDVVTGMPANWVMHAGQLCVQSDDGPQTLYGGTIEFGQPFKEKDPATKNDVQYLPLHAVAHRDRHELFLHMGMHASMQELKKAFATVGILPEVRAEKEFFNGMRAWIQKINDESTSVKPVRQMGWQSHDMTDTNAGFVIGETLYTPGKQTHVRVDATAEKQSRHMHAEGSLDEWKRAINVYTRPEYHSYALMSWLQFGAPLARLLGTGMPIAHFNSQGSGHGKTGTQDLLLSGAGNPRDPNGRWTGNTTIISIYAYLTAMNGNIAVLDETSAIAPEVLGKLMFEATLGSGRKAMAGASGQTRDLPPITGILCTSGNMSLQQLAQTMKGNSEAQVARVFEFNVRRPPMSKDQRYADQELFKLVYTNFGHAMPIFIKYVVDNQAKVKVQLASVERQLVGYLGMENEERYWRALLTVCITGALIAQQLGLIDHDVSKLSHSALDHFMYQRATLKDETSQSHALYQFTQDNQNTILVVDSDTPTSTLAGIKLVVAARTPPAHINVRARYVMDTDLLFVDRRYLRAYCSDKNIDFRQLISDAQRDGWLAEDNVRRELTAYTRISTPARATCVCFDMKKALTVASLLKGTP